MFDHDKSEHAMQISLQIELKIAFFFMSVEFDCIVFKNLLLHSAISGV